MKTYITKQILILLAMSIGLLLTGCASHQGHDQGYGMQGRSAMVMEAAPVSSLKSVRSGNHDMNSSDTDTPRKLIKRSWLTLSVKDLAQAEKQAKTIIEQQSGYIQNTQGEQGKSFNLSIRVPQEQYDMALAELRQVGEIKSEKRV